MPTVRWETRTLSPHHYFRSLERFHMVQMFRDLKLILIFFMLEMSDYSSGCITLPLLTKMTIFLVEDDLRRIRPSNFYLPAGFYPRGSDDSFWDDHSDHFFTKFRFRVPHFSPRLCSGKATLSLVAQARTRFVLISASWFFFAAWLIHADSLIWSKILECPQTGSAKYFTQYWRFSLIAPLLWGAHSACQWPAEDRAQLGCPRQPCARRSRPRSALRRRRVTR